MRNASLYFLSLIFAVLLLFGCSGEKRKVSTSFYYWKTHFELTDREEAYINSLETKKLYLRFFDVDWNFNKNIAVPIASIDLGREQLSEYEIVPTVFITNRTMVQIPYDDVPLLAARIVNRIFQIADSLPIKEIQLDCDWSETSRDNYFRLLDQIKAQIGEKKIQISSTIRLHQVKYFMITGVPPVDKGMLMFYNIGDVKDITTKNSILDLKLAESYLNEFESYPLKLDFALPLFSWGVVMRNDKTVQLINNLRANQLEDKQKFRFLDPKVIKVLKSTYINGFYLYKGDFIRLEDVKLTDLKESAELLAEIDQENDVTICFYHLDSPTIEKYSHEELMQICETFR
ncbi:MAG: hypothetical protein KDE26_13115 [Bacteroidetes bacterium]|nr:hypothetical protein [Bacteroidota bacterium]